MSNIQKNQKLPYLISGDKEKKFAAFPEPKVNLSPWFTDSEASLKEKSAMFSKLYEKYKTSEREELERQMKAILPDANTNLYLAGNSNSTAQSGILLNLMHQDLREGKQVILIDNGGMVAKKAAGSLLPEQVRKALYCKTSAHDRYIMLNILSVNEFTLDRGSELFIAFLKRYFDESIITDSLQENLKIMFGITARYSREKYLLSVFRMIWDKDFFESEFRPLFPMMKSFLEAIPEETKLNAKRIEKAFSDSVLPMMTGAGYQDAFEFNDQESRQLIILDLERPENRFEDEFLWYSLMAKVACALDFRKGPQATKSNISLFIHDTRGMLNFFPDFCEDLDLLSRLVLSDANEKNLEYLSPEMNFKSVVCSLPKARYGQVADLTKIEAKNLPALREDQYMLPGKDAQTLVVQPISSENFSKISSEYSRLKWGRKDIFIEQEIGELFFEKAWKPNHQRSGWISMAPDYRVSPKNPLFKTKPTKKNPKKSPWEELLESEKLLKAEHILARRVIAQDEALQALSDRVRTGVLGFKVNRCRPNGVYFFLGPTGVGKTELAKALAELLFGDEKHLIRYDMSEFYDYHTVSNLIGSPKGYVGNDDGGALINKIKEQPQSVILFDEIEKAHKSIFNTFLQMIDEGRLTDGKGNTGDFSQAFIIFTSNLGQELLSPAIGFLEEGKKPEQVDPNDVLKLLEKRFSQEFVGRMDKCIFFKNLNQASLLKICELKMNQTQKILQEKGIELIYAKSVLTLILKEASKVENKNFITRQIQRVIYSLILEPLAKLVLSKKRKKVKVTVRDKTIQLG